MDGELHEVGEVQATKPDNRRAVATLLTCTLLAVVMQIPGRRDNDISGVHCYQRPCTAVKPPFPSIMNRQANAE